MRVEGPKGVRSIPIADLYRLPDQTPELETTLEPGEVIVEIIVSAAIASGVRIT